MAKITGNTTGFIQHGVTNKPTIFYIFKKGENKEKYKVIVSNEHYKNNLIKNFKTGLFVEIDGLIIEKKGFQDYGTIFISNEPYHRLEYL